VIPRLTGLVDKDYWEGKDSPRLQDALDTFERLEDETVGVLDEVLDLTSDRFDGPEHHYRAQMRALIDFLWFYLEFSKGSEVVDRKVFDESEDARRWEYLHGRGLCNDYAQAQSLGEGMSRDHDRH
jgi:hypothetical protein